VTERRGRFWREWLAIAFGVANLVYAAHRLPPAPVLVRRAGTPLDHSRIHSSAAEYRLLARAAQLIPVGVRVVVRSATDDAEREFFLHRFGVSLLPGRRVLPAAAIGPPGRDAEAVDYAVVVGSPPVSGRGELLAADEDGSIWRMRRP
jgi:hypothetical protein